MSKLRKVFTHHVTHREWRRRLHAHIPNLKTRCGASPEAIAVDWGRVTCKACLDTMTGREFDRNPPQSMCATVFHVEGVDLVRDHWPEGPR